MNQAKDQNRALRLRDNKRRHRQRHKEYVADLERRLTETRERGVHATLQVSWENRRLRQILHRQGLDTDAISSLIYNDARISCASPSPTIEAPRPTREHDEAIERMSDAIAANIEYSSTTSNGKLPVKANAQHNMSSPETACTGKTSHNVARSPPCKLLTILAGNPNADITQMPGAANEQKVYEKPGGVECLQAREMLMRFATTEDKLDDIASP